MRTHVMAKWVVFCFLYFAFITKTVIADTEVEFSGTLITDPCVIDTDSDDQTVEFNPISTKRFLSYEESAPVKFSIWLRECDLSLGNQVAVTFFGNKEQDRPDLFSVIGTANGIALSIKDSNSHQISPGKQQSPIILYGEDNRLDWQATIRTLVGEAVTDGEFMTVLTFSLEYE